MTDGFFLDRLAAHGVWSRCRRPSTTLARRGDLRGAGARPRAAAHPQQGRRIIHQLWDAGAAGVLLGCTELELLVHQSDVELPVFPCTTLHVEAALDRALA